MPHFKRKRAVQKGECLNSPTSILNILGYIEATSILPLGSQSLEVEALLLVLPSTDHQKRVPIAIGTTITDMVVDFINKTNPDNLSKFCKAVCCATQSKWLVQAQPENKFLVRTTKPVTLPPFSTTTIRRSTKHQAKEPWDEAQSNC